MDKQNLRWHLRRGMKELDVLLQRYHERRFAEAPPAEQGSFLRLLECEDPQIWAWVLAQEAVPVEFADVVARLRVHH